MPTMSSHDALVIGAGVSGLVAAEILAAAGRRVAVLEARDRVGGRTWTVDTESGLRVDIGGQWLGPTQQRAHGLVQRLGLRTYPQFHDGAKCLQRDGRLSEYSGTIPALPFWGLIDLQLNLWRIDRRARRLTADSPWLADDAEALDRLSVEDWLKRHARSDSAREMIRLATHAVFAQEPGRISLLQFFSYVRNAGGLMDLLEIDGGAQQTRIAGGAQALSTGLAERLSASGGELRLSTPVRGIEAGQDGVRVHTDNGALDAPRVIVAMAPADAGRIDWRGSLHPRRRELFERQPAGSAIKCIAIYDQPFWRADGRSGELVSDDEPLRMSFDGSPPDTSRGALVGFILGDAARRWSERGPAARREAVCAQLATVFGPRAAEPIEYLDQDWCREQWTGGCYTGLFAPGGMQELAPLLRAQDGRVHWAGTETATRWTGYIDGAVEAGERAATEVLSAR